MLVLVYLSIYLSVANMQRLAVALLSHYSSGIPAQLLKGSIPSHSGLALKLRCFGPCRKTLDRHQTRTRLQ